MQLYAVTVNVIVLLSSPKLDSPRRTRPDLYLQHLLFPTDRAQVPKVPPAAVSVVELPLQMVVVPVIPVRQLTLASVNTLNSVFCGSMLFSLCIYNYPC
jgi:hypothetical protein